MQSHSVARTPKCLKHFPHVYPHQGHLLEEADSEALVGGSDSCICTSNGEIWKCWEVCCPHRGRELGNVCPQLGTVTPGTGPFSLTDQTTFSLGTTLAHIRNGAK